jgi:hypothetical protein
MYQKGNSFTLWAVLSRLFWLSYALFEDVRFVFHIYSLLWFIKTRIGGPLWKLRKLKIRISFKDNYQEKKLKD